MWQNFYYFLIEYYAIIYEIKIEENEWDIFVKYADGNLGTASINNEQGFWVADFYQSHIVKNEFGVNLLQIKTYDDLVTELGEGKAYWEQYPEKTPIQEVFENCIDWLWVDHEKVPKNIPIIEIDNRDKVIAILKKWGHFYEELNIQMKDGHVGWLKKEWWWKNINFRRYPKGNDITLEIYIAEKPPLKLTIDYIKGTGKFIFKKEPYSLDDLMKVLNVLIKPYNLPAYDYESLYDHIAELAGPEEEL